MTLYQVVSCLPGCQLVTVADYLSGDIYVDSELAEDVVYSEFKSFRVYKIEVFQGCYSDLIISVLNED